MASSAWDAVLEGDAADALYCARAQAAGDWSDYEGDDDAQWHDEVGAVLGAAFLGGFLLLHDSSRSARRAARALRLRPARGMAPWVSGSHRSVLHRATPPPPPPLAVASACPGAVHTTLEAVSSKLGRSACRARDTRRSSASRAPLRRSLGRLAPLSGALAPPSPPSLSCPSASGSPRSSLAVIVVCSPAWLAGLMGPT